MLVLALIILVFIFLRTNIQKLNTKIYEDGKNLSAGQRQRILIARSIFNNPKLLVMDEPTSALDVSVQAQIIDLLRELQKSHNITYLFISHDLKVVRAMSHEIVVMRHGKIVEQGPAAQIIDNPREPYTKALMAAAFELKADDSGMVSD